MRKGQKRDKMEREGEIMGEKGYRKGGGMGW